MTIQTVAQAQCIVERAAFNMSIRQRWNDAPVDEAGHAWAGAAVSRLGPGPSAKGGLSPPSKGA